MFNGQVSTHFWLKRYKLQLLILLKFAAFTSSTITIGEQHNNNSTATINNTTNIKHDLAMLRIWGRTLGQCLSQTERRWLCVEKQVAKVIDSLIDDNSTWQYGDYIVIEKLKSNGSKVEEGRAEADLYSKQDKAQRQRSLKESTSNMSTNSKSNSNSIAESLWHLAKSRSIRLHFPTTKQALKQLGAGISDAIDVLTLEDYIGAGGSEWFTTEAAAVTQMDEGTQRKLNGLVDDKLEQLKHTTSQNNNNKLLLNDKNNQHNEYSNYERDAEKQRHKYKDNYNKVKDSKDKDEHSKKLIKNKLKKTYISFNNKNSLKGRKKKYKEKNMAMLVGVAMIVMVAQMFLSKVMLIAGAAFVMAKVAMAVSVLGSLKKESTHGSTSTDHIVLTEHSHGHGYGGHGHGYGGHGGHSGHSGADDYHSAGWHRSMPHIYHNKPILAAAPEIVEKHFQKPSELFTAFNNHESHDYNKYEYADINNDVHTSEGVDYSSKANLLKIR